MENWWWILWC